MSAEDSSPFKVLVLEDDQDLCQMLVDVLRDEGYDVTAALDGTVALELCSQQEFDLIVTDVRLPGMDGLECLSQVRQQQPHLDSLVVSGYTSEAETLRALSLNVGGYLKKPFSLHDLLAKVRDLLKERQRQRHLFQIQNGLLGSLNWVAHKFAQLYRPDDSLAAHKVREQAQAQGLDPRPLELAILLGWMQPDDVVWQKDSVGLGAVRELLEPTAPSSALLQWAQRAAQMEAQESTCEPAPVLTTSVQSPAFDRARTLSHSLAVAQSLELQGKLGLAQQGYAQVANQATDEPRTRLEALLGLARVGWSKSGDADRQGPMTVSNPNPSNSSLGSFDGYDWYASLQEAERVARRLGGPLAGEARWTIAKLLWRCDHASKRDYLKTLEQECAHARDRVGWARCRLLAQPDPQAAAVFLEPQFFSFIVPEENWMVEKLLEHSQLLDRPSAWCRLASEFPTLVHRWLEHHRAQSPALEKIFLQHRHLLSSEFQEKLPAPSQVNQAEQVYLRVRMFGDFEILANGHPVEEKYFKSQKNKFLLAYLLENRGRFVTEDAIVEEFWPNSSDGGKASIYAASTAIRRVLRQEKSKIEVIERDSGRLRLSPDLSVWLDTEELRAALQSQGHSDWHLRQLQLYRGPFLPNCFQNWATLVRNRWEENMVGAFEKMGKACIEQDPAQACELAQMGLELDPMSMELHALKMQAYLKISQPEKAIRQFQKCSAVLASELGIEPTTELIELFHRSKLALP